MDKDTISNIASSRRLSAKLRSIGALVLFAALCSFTSVCSAQWYQGPAGGHGGKYFDDWQAQGQRYDLMNAGVWIDGSDNVRCFWTTYRGDPSLHPLYGYCPTAPGQANWNFSTQNRGVALAKDEYLVGISFRYADYVKAIRFYTNKQTGPWIGSSTAGDREIGFTAPPGYMIIGFIGRAGQDLDGLGVIYAKCTPEKNPCR